MVGQVKAVELRQGPHLSIRIGIWILPWIGRQQCYLVELTDTDTLLLDSVIVSDSPFGLTHSWESCPSSKLFQGGEQSFPFEDELASTLRACHPSPPNKQVLARCPI